MDAKEGKVRKHKFSNNQSFVKVLIIAILMMFGYFYAAQFGFGIIAAITLAIMNKSSDTVESAVTFLAIFGGFLALLFYYHWYKPEYHWKPRNTAFAFKITAPILIYWFILYGVLYTIAAGHITFGIKNVSVLGAIFSVSAGVSEEVAFREIGISFIKRQIKEDKMNLPIVIIVSVIFGLTHLINGISSSIPIYYFFLQALWTSCLGIFFGAVFLRTGNIWPCLIAHVIHDLSADFFRANFDVEDEPAYIGVWMTVGLAMLAVYGLYLIRKEKHPEIREVWNAKWLINPTPYTDNPKT